MDLLGKHELNPEIWREINVKGNRLDTPAAIETFFTSRGVSKTDFQKILGRLQNENITVYALQLPDRTGGAFRRNQPKAAAVLNQLTEGTGGAIYPLDEAQAAAKAICDELRHNRYLLSYIPVNTSSYDIRRVFLTAAEGITIRTKTAQPPNVK